MSGDRTAAALSILGTSYEIVRELGRGGTSLVYLARERESGTEVAIKLIRAKYVEDEETLARFAREARYVGGLHHPNVVALRSVVELGDLGLALVMDHVRGRTLKQTIQESGPLPPSQAESVLRDIAAALRAAHAMGIVHRDVKPENIFIDPEGRALLADFGVARSMTSETQLTMSGIAIGTPAYMAPEQIDGIPLDGRGDIYSLGLVGWEMLTGKRPWEGASLYAVIYKQKHELLPDVRDMRPGIPDRLASVIAGAIEKDRTARWQSAEELIAALDGKSAQRTQSPRPTLAEQTRRFVRPSTAAMLGSTDIPAPAAMPEEQPIALASPLEAVLADIASNDLGDSEQPAPSRRRLIVGGGVLGLMLVAFGLFALQGRTGTAAGAAGEVVAGVQAGRPARPVERLSGTPTTDSTKHIALADSPAPQTIPIVKPELRVAQATAEPSPTLIQRGVERAIAAQQAAQNDSADAGKAGPDSTARRDTVAAASTSTTEPRAAPVAAPAAPTPALPPAPTSRVSVATGGAHTCLVMASGRAFCWGGNDRGQLGSGNTTRLASPAGVATDVRFDAIASGLSHSCALSRVGVVWCWGENDHGQLGDRSSSARLTPVPVADNHSFRSVVAGAAHTCGLDAAGKAWCWGSNARGQLGAGDADSGDSAAPIAVTTDRRFVSLALGWSFSCALDTTGAALCWGDNSAGQLGDGTHEDRRVPTAVRSSARFVAITAGSGHACGITASGDAYCWGRNARGQLGDGTKTDQTTPVRVKAPVRFVAIAAGAVHTCGISSEGDAYCWGQNTYGQLGDGGTTDHATPVAVAGDHAFASVRAFGSHTCAATASGEAFCWGYNLDGQLGDGTRVHRTRPVYVEPPTGK